MVGDAATRPHRITYRKLTDDVAGMVTPPRSGALLLGVPTMPRMVD